jgi:hypothetical protein
LWQEYANSFRKTVFAFADYSGVKSAGNSWSRFDRDRSDGFIVFSRMKGA